MKMGRHGLVLVAFSLLGCGRSDTTRRDSAVADHSADSEVNSDAALDIPAFEDADSSSDAAAGPEVNLDAAWDVGVFVDAEISADGSSDSGTAGSCGSRLSFQIVAATGVDPGSFCTYGCNWIERIAFTSGSFQVTADDIAQPACVPLCDTCDKLPDCHSCVGINPFPATGLNYVWDGHYFPSGTCGGGQSCRGPQVCAPAGHYTGEFCALRGTTVSGRCTPSQGLGSQDVSCTTVELDLPSTATFTVELGP